MSQWVSGCHCGAVQVCFRSERAPTAWPLRRCTCSFCVRFGAVYTSDPSGSIEIRSDARLRRYRFGQHSADFLFCPVCGVYLGASCEVAGGMLAVLNVRVLDRVPLELEQAQPVNFDQESVEVRTARRQRHWTPAQLIESGA